MPGYSVDYSGLRSRRKNDTAPPPELLVVMSVPLAPELLVFITVVPAPEVSFFMTQASSPASGRFQT